MILLLHYIKKYPFSGICIALIWVLSLLPFFPETPFDHVELIDKWVHIAMYGGAFTVVWIEYTLKHQKPDYEKLFFWAWLAPIVMSGVLELMQEYCTGGARNGDWLDLLANAIGVSMATIIGMLILAVQAIRKKGA